MSERSIARAGRPTAPAFSPVAHGVLQRKCACGQQASGGECEECKKNKGTLQRKATSAAGPAMAPPIVHEVLSSPGQPLDKATRDYFEPKFGYDFSKVRVHTDAKAAESAEAVNALAYAAGTHVAFGNQFQPSRVSGRQILAHELTHVMQQASAASDNLPNDLSIAQSNSSMEDEADNNALRLSDSATGADQVTKAVPSLQRKPKTLGTRVTQPKGATRPFKKIAATFDGQDFAMTGDGKEILKAPGQSGRPLAVRAKDAKTCGGSIDDCYMNNGRYVGIADNGPLPEGEFTFARVEMVQFTSAEESDMRLASEGEYVDPSGQSLHGDWGSARAPLRPAKILPSRTCGSTATRSGFFLHGGVMPGSSGCIDIGDTAITNVVNLLLGYPDPVHLSVKYTKPAPGCGFVSKAAGRFMYPSQNNPSLGDRIKNVFGLGSNDD